MFIAENISQLVAKGIVCFSASVRKVYSFIAHKTSDRKEYATVTGDDNPHSAINKCRDRYCK